MSGVSRFSVLRWDTVTTIPPVMYGNGQGAGAPLGDAAGATPFKKMFSPPSRNVRKFDIPFFTAGSEMEQRGRHDVLAMRSTRQCVSHPVLSGNSIDRNLKQLPRLYS